MDDHKKSQILDEAAAHHGEECPVGQVLRASARAYGARADRGTSRGPAQVATDEYRDHYDTIFGGKTPVPEA